MQNVSRGDEHLPRQYQRALRRYHLNDSGLTGTPFNLYTSRRFKSLINLLRPDRERSTLKTGRSLKRLSRKGSRHQERRQMQQSVLSQQTYKFTVLGTEFTESRKMNWCKFAWLNCHCNPEFIQTSEVTYLLTTLCAVPCTWELRL